MNLYEIDNAMMQLIDSETGEIMDYSVFEMLNMERERKIENIGLWVKNLLAEADAIKEEERKLAERRKAAENKAARLKEYLLRFLEGEKFKTPRVAMSFRKYTALDVSEDFVGWAVHDGAEQYLRFAAPSPDKDAIKKAVAAGVKLPFVQMVERQSIIIK